MSLDLSTLKNYYYLQKLKSKNKIQKQTKLSDVQNFISFQILLFMVSFYFKLCDNFQHSTE